MRRKDRKEGESKEAEKDESLPEVMEPPAADREVRREERASPRSWRSPEED